MTNREMSRRQFGEIAIKTTIGGLLLPAAAMLALPPPEAQATPEELPPFLYWNGEYKRTNAEAGRKFCFIPGMNTRSDGDNTFRHAKQALRDIGYDDMDFLDWTYNTDNSKLVGKSYTEKHSNQHPLISLDNARQLNNWVRKNCPNDELWYLGHSQGGWIAEHLAIETSDENPAAVGGLFTFDGALKGADFIPSDIDGFFAPVIGGQAAPYFLQLARDKRFGQMADKNIATLNSRGSITITFADTGDPIVRPQFAHSDATATSVGGYTFRTQFPMHSWDRSWNTPHLVVKDMKEYERFVKSMEYKSADDSARLTPSKEEVVQDDFFRHSAVTENGEVLHTMRYVVVNTPLKLRPDSPDYQKSMEQIHREEEENLKRMTP